MPFACTSLPEPMPPKAVSLPSAGETISSAPPPAGRAPGLSALVKSALSEA